MHNEGQNSCPLFMNFNKWRQILQTSYNKPLSRVLKRTILFLELPLGSSILNDELLTMNYELKKHLSVPFYYSACSTIAIEAEAPILVAPFSTTAIASS